MNTMNKTKTVSPYFAFILLHSLQIGIGILGYQRVILKMQVMMLDFSYYCRYCNSYCTVLYVKMLEKDGDLISIHTTTFGKWVGSIFSVIFTLYCLLFCLTVLHTYMEVIQVWIFPTIKLWKLTLMFY